MKVSVIVPAFNEAKLIRESLASIQAAMTVFTARGWESELIVCDNNSTDATGELARVAGARVVFEPVNQISRARNTGAAAASGGWFIFVDADSLPSSGLFGEVADQITAGHCVAGGCTVHMDADALWAAVLCRLWNWLSVRSTLLAGSFIFCEAKAFHEVGGFNQELFASEEIDLSRKLKRWAKRNGRTVVILDRHPLLTSGRKANLYSGGETALFMIRVIFGMGRPLRSRKACFHWYDGRR